RGRQADRRATRRRAADSAADWRTRAAGYLFRPDRHRPVGVPATGDPPGNHRNHADGGRTGDRAPVRSEPQQRGPGPTRPVSSDGAGPAVQRVSGRPPECGRSDRYGSVAQGETATRRPDTAIYAGLLSEMPTGSDENARSASSPQELAECSGRPPAERYSRGGASPRIPP